jgi:hypothetical protein
VADGLHKAGTIRSNRQQKSDDDQTDGVRQSEAPEHDGRNGTEQQKLHQPDDDDHNAVLIHRVGSASQYSSGTKVRPFSDAWSS